MLCQNVNGMSDLENHIKSFLFDCNEHILVLSERKRRNPNQGRLRSISDTDSDSDDYFIYTTIETNMCKPCFLFGINNYYKNNNRLPYLRRDIFCFECQNQEDINIFDKFYIENYNSYILPNIYELRYYRTEDFESVNGKYKITQN